MNRAQMTAPFAEEELRQFEGRGGKTMTFIEDETVMDRLDAGYGYGNWQLQVEEARVDGVVKVRLGVRENGEWAWYEDFGYPNQKGGDELKEAVSDGIRRCGRYLGIARDLYRKSTYEPGGALGPKAKPEPVQPDEETLDLIGIDSVNGVVKKGGADRYQSEWRETPSGPVIGFALKRNGDKDLPQVGIMGDIARALFATGDYPEGPELIGQRVSLKGRFYAVRRPGKTTYTRVIVGQGNNDYIATEDWRIPPEVSPRREDEPEPIPIADGQEALPFDPAESARLDAEAAAAG